MIDDKLVSFYIIILFYYHLIVNEFIIYYSFIQSVSRYVGTFVLRHLLTHRTIPSSSSYHPYHHNTNCHRHRHPIIVILSSSYHPSIIIISLPSLPSISSPSSHHLQNMHHLSFIVYLISQPVQRHNPSSSFPPNTPNYF